MSQMAEYDRGYRDAVRAAITWLHRRAAEMSDPHAKRVLNSAATHLGWDRAHSGIPEPGQSGPVCVEAPAVELESLRRAHSALESVAEMADDAFNRGRIFEPTHVPMIALAGKISQEANAGLGR